MMVTGNGSIGRGGLGSAGVALALQRLGVAKEVCDY